MRALLVSCVLCVARVSAAQSDVFFGWSTDGTWLVFSRPGRNEVTELYFCQTSEVAPKWPSALNEQEKLNEGGLECVRFLDQNKAPYQWQKLVTAGESTMARHGMSIASELVNDGESPGFVLHASGKTQSCYASGLKETSKLQKAFWHPSARFVAALIDGTFHHCTVTLKASKPNGPVKKK